MTLTAFPNGISSFGIPIIGSSAPFGRLSKVFFVDPVNGSDGDKGISSSKPLKTLSKAHSLCTAGRNDVVYLMGNGQTSGTARETATLVWSKDATHLIGVAAPGFIAQRARISTASSTSAVTPIMTVSADGCMFQNLHLFQDFSTDAANICVEITGERDVFINCHIAGGGNATGADNAGMRSLKITGGTGNGEHFFKHCVIGLDTIDRGDAASAEIEIDGASTRNVFEDCLILARTDGTAPNLLLIGTSGIDRFCIFRDCIFWNDIVGGGTAMAELLDVVAAAGGDVLLMNCVTKGGTAVETTNHGAVFLSQEVDTVADTLAV